MIAAYVTGHGYGHATRTAEVLRAVREQDPGVPLAVVSSAPESLFREAVGGSLLYRRQACDVGLAQQGALVIDEAATREGWRAFEEGRPALVAAEAAWLRGAGARVVLGDIPPLAFEAAAGAGVPGVGLGNFSWDWIYAHLAKRAEGFREPAERAAAAYARAHLLLELPFAGDLSAFPRRERIPLVARPSRRGRPEARRLLGFPPGPVALVTFGGMGLPGFSARVLGGLDRFGFALETEERDLPANVRGFRPGELRSLGLTYRDVIGAADSVVTKPGYGIVSDCVAAGTRIVYTDRGDFPEYEVMVAEMGRYVPCVYVSNDEVRTGRLGDALEAVLAAPLPPPPRLDGAAVAARRLLEVEAGGG